MPWRIDPDELTDPAVVALLEEHVRELRSISPPESTHALDLDALRAPGVDVWVARDVGPAGGSEPGLPIGCGALTLVEPGHGELKSMRTASAATGRGVGTALLEHVLDQARARGLSRVSLETGAEDFFAPARRLYLRHGFEVCPPFGRYRPDPLSVFMTRSLP
ncbi:GNAT family N-acetyltransferase [Nocardioides ginkgobilobae]